MFLSHLVFAWNVWQMTYARQRADVGAILATEAA
jgi:hypothetical protein